MSRAAFPALLTALGLALAACSGNSGAAPESRSSAAVRAACTQRAEQIYTTRNRAEIYAPQSSVNTPYSANYQPGVTNRGLADLYERDNIIRDCIRNTGTETSREVPPTPAPPSPVVRP
ncbi:MAG: hypothetical protein BGO51_06070 [Rhodospirillales bacterium 69-11]|nr:hypothetical protein [Rhodospirillales bacterium]OJW27280.1 MAG: hypothetical protein BGO51_06070 [Rhodospirillales bacterium 69-11]